MDVATKQTTVVKTKATEKERILNPKEFTQEEIDIFFPVVDVRSLSLDDKFLRHDISGLKANMFKKELIKVIKSGIPNFRVQAMDPSLDRNNIVYKKGMKPALRKSAIWWNENAKLVLPNKNSRIGSSNQRIAFLGVLIKYLSEHKYDYSTDPINDAWRDVCIHSDGIGYYRYSDTDKNEIGFSPTGTKQVGVWHDLANTYKILFDEKSGRYALAGGSCHDTGRGCPLADISDLNCPYSDFSSSLGWIVTDV